MAELSIQFPAKDVAALMTQIERQSKALGIPIMEATQNAAKLVAYSAAAATKEAPALRKVVKNPDKRWKTDKRVAPLGVMRYKKGQHVFQPIFRTGEFGEIRFFDRKSASWFVRDAANPKGRWEKIQSGPDIANPEVVVPGIMNDKRRIIKRRGLARKSWQIIGAKIGGSSAVASGKSNASPDTSRVATNFGHVSIDNDRMNPSVTMSNTLGYAGKAIRKSLDSIVGKASRRMSWMIGNAIKQKMQVAV